VRRYSGSGNGYDDAIDLVLDNQSNVYVTGATLELGHSFDFTTIKYNAAGTQQWLISYNGPPGNGDDYASAIAIDKAKNLYVTGGSDIGGLTFHLLTIKYSQFVGIKTINEHLPQTSTLYQNYPNPFNPITKIRFDIPSNAKDGNVKLIIYDMLGSEIAVLVNENLNPGTYNIEWDGSDYPSGVYFYKLQTDNYSKTKKLVLIK
jgi:hypothetical protein